MARNYKHNLSHLTHWNHERTRGVRIYRVYLNFDIVGATLEVQTLHHPGSDHKGVLFNASPTSGRECFGEWDVVKSKVKNFAQHTWEVRGPYLVQWVRSLVHYQ